MQVEPRDKGGRKSRKKEGNEKERGKGRKGEGKFGKKNRKN
jgi:hypothetical protein